jgi:hypothetical protein
VVDRFRSVQVARVRELASVEWASHAGGYLGAVGEVEHDDVVPRGERPARRDGGDVHAMVADHARVEAVSLDHGSRGDLHDFIASGVQRLDHGLGYEVLVRQVGVEWAFDPVCDLVFVDDRLGREPT